MFVIWCLHSTNVYVEPGLVLMSPASCNSVCAMFPGLSNYPLIGECIK